MNLREIFQSEFHEIITAQHPVGGGCINQCILIETESGLRYFVKKNSNTYNQMFRKEATGLEELAKQGYLRVPKVHRCIESHDSQILVLEYLVSARKRPDFWSEFGRGFARMHRDHCAERFGYKEDNFIGSSIQKNTWKNSWIDFFIEERLNVQMDLLGARGLLDSTLQTQLRKLIGKLADFIEPGVPSLLHGDLWSGNFMVGPEGEAVILDPAIYYGHREADLAMTELFGGFHQEFYHAYQEEWPLEPGWEDRIPLYKLYHMLNHMTIFGAGYYGSVMSLLAELPS
jgi:protein-ribulosamine 3-kinase